MEETNTEAMHRNGVHTHCTWGECRLAGKVERFHGHDFEGPLWDACGCDELL